MKVKIVQHVWHSKEPVFSLDFHPAGYLVTGGSDKTINIWDINSEEDGSPVVTHVADLQGHARAVNCVRFSHSGHSLASSGDNGEIIIWRPAAPGTPPPFGSVAAAATPAPVAATPQTPLTAAKPGIAAATAEAAAATAADGSGSSPKSNTPPLTPAGAGSPPQAAGAASSCSWKQFSSLRGHTDDVMDLAWSHDDAVLMSGSVDNEVMMFDVDTRRPAARFTNHRHFVQGVAWDPLGSYMVSYSQDRTVRVHTLKPPPSGGRGSNASKTSAQLARDIIQTATLSKRTVPLPPTPPQASAADATAAHPDQQQQQKPTQVYMFQDETLDVFFRRLAWSPDGSLLAIPAGLMKDDSSATRNTTYIYARGHWSQPLASLPCPAKASVAVKFCPLLFKLRSSSAASAGAAAGTPSVAAAGAGMKNVLGLPYRLVLAVATLDSVLLYDMQTLEPFLLIGPLHYSQITDLAWSRDGSYLAVSSRDGYCSIITFKQGELGDYIPESELPGGLATALQRIAAQTAATASKCAASNKAVGNAAAVTPVNARPASASAAAAGASPGTAGVGALTAGAAPSSGQQQQQQQKQGIKRIQPQQVVSGSSPASGAAAAGQLRRICPSPIGAGASPGAAAPAGQQSRGAAAPAPRRVTPTPVSPAAATTSTAAVVDLTGDDVRDPPAVTAAAAAPAGSSGGRLSRPSSAGGKPIAASGKSSSPGSAAAAAAKASAAPAPRRVTPQPVSMPNAAAASGDSKQQQDGGLAPAATVRAAPATAPAGRVGVAAIQAALAAAKKKAAAKRAAEQAAERAAADGGEAKKAKTGAA